MIEINITNEHVAFVVCNVYALLIRVQHFIAKHSTRNNKTFSTLLSLPCYIVLTHWGRETHICVSELTSIGSDNGLSPGRHQAIIRTNAGILLKKTLRNKLQWNFSRNSKIFIQENAFESVVWEKAAILSRLQWVKSYVSIKAYIIGLLCIWHNTLSLELQKCMDSSLVHAIDLYILLATSPSNLSFKTPLVS